MKLSNLSNQSQFYRQALGRKLVPASKPIYFTGSANKLIKAAANEGENVIDQIGQKNQIRERISAFCENVFHKKPFVLKKPIVTAANPTTYLVNGLPATAQQASQAVNAATQGAVQLNFTGHPAVQQAAQQGVQQVGAVITAIAAALIGW